MAEVKSDSEEESNGWTATVGRVGMSGQRHSGRVLRRDEWLCDHRTGIDGVQIGLFSRHWSPLASDFFARCSSEEWANIRYIVSRTKRDVRLCALTGAFLTLVHQVHEGGRKCEVERRKERMSASKKKKPRDSLTLNNNRACARVYNEITCTRKIRTHRV